MPVRPPDPEIWLSEGGIGWVAGILDLVPPPEPLNDTVARVVARNASVRPNEPAIIEARRGTTMTWREYDDAANAVAVVLARHPRGERVALQMPDGPEVHVVMAGCERAGVVAVGIGARAGPREVAHLCAAPPRASC
jgi:acyl-CoA synthetase (AMP-forming)/AMP-acid ligase II